MLTVADHGPGFPEEFLAEAFEPFSQGERRLTRTAGGAGLGLYIAKGMVEAMGGAIEAANGPTGAVITIRLVGAPA